MNDDRPAARTEDERAVFDPAHPLFALNQTFLAFRAAVQQADKTYGLVSPSPDERKAWATRRAEIVKPALIAHNAEEQRLIKAGVRFVFHEEPNGAGYFILDLIPPH